MNKSDITNFLIEKYNTLFTNNRDFLLVFAPGRINLIGEHTDYTGGVVLPAAIDCGTYLLLKPNDTNFINISSLNFEEKKYTIDISKSIIKSNLWTDYLLGILSELNKAGILIQKGFDGVIFGNIPNGSGLSSSASLEMALILGITAVNNVEIPKPGSQKMIDYTLIAQKAENNFVGVNCGIMDQFVIGNAKKNKAIKLDCSNLNFEYCNVTLDDYTILVLNTNKQRKLEESKYNERREECEKGYELLKKFGIEKNFLGKVTVSELNKYIDNIKSISPILVKRLYHIVTENNRVMEAFISLKEKNLPKFASLINQSGDSLRNYYEVTGHHLDAIVDAAKSTVGVIASRMTGAGFGGCAISIVEKSKIKSVKKSISEKYYNSTGITPEFYNFKISDGAKILTL